LIEYLIFNLLKVLTVWCADLSLIDEAVLGIVIDECKLFAQLLNMIADVEERYGRRFDDVLKELLSPARLTELYKRLPPDVYGELIGSLLQFYTVTSQNPLTLPPSEKREAASEIIKLANSLERVIEKLKGV
jgi:hypothetical protein